jgi:tellurite resistance protein TehA-like permease
LIGRLKASLTTAAVTAVAGVFAALALFAVLYGLLRIWIEPPWAFAATAGLFALAAFIAARSLKSRAAKHEAAEHADHEHHGLAGLASGLPGQLGVLQSQVATFTKGRPMLAYGAGALAAIVLIRRPRLIWLIGSNLLGMKVQKRRDKRRGMWTR